MYIDVYYTDTVLSK